MVQRLQNFANFQIFQLDNLVDFEKCCKTHIYLQKSVPIQPKTSNILQKFCQKLATASQPTRVSSDVKLGAGKDLHARRAADRDRRDRPRPTATAASCLRTRLNNIEQFSPNFEGLVLGCIDADFCK